MKQTNLNCYNSFAVNSGFDYIFNVSQEGEDLTGRSYFMDIKESKDAVPYLLQLTTGIDGTISSIYMPTPASGSFDVIIKGVDSASIDNVHSVYELYYTSATNNKVLVLSGELQFSDGSIA